jgi:hypothetical protein
MRHFPLFLAISALAFSNTAAAAEQANKCVTRAELRGGVGYLLPQILEGARNFCIPHLADSSFLSTKGANMIQAYKNSRTMGDKEVYDLAIRIFGDNPPPGIKDNPELMAQLFTSMIQEGMTKDLKPKDCQLIDTILSDLAPLPPANMFGLIETFLIEMDKDATKKEGKSRKSRIPAGMICQGVS